VTPRLAFRDRPAKEKAWRDNTGPVQGGHTSLSQDELRVGRPPVPPITRPRQAGKAPGKFWGEEPAFPWGRSRASLNLLVFEGAGSC
jgi:hypothetical protein